MPAVGDHVRPAEAEFEGGVYRVVGTADGVALLRVADTDGRRVHSGDLRHVSEDVIAANFEPAEDPDAGFTPVRTIANQLQGLYWQFRRFF